MLDFECLFYPHLTHRGISVKVICMHTFHLIPSGTLCDHWSGQSDALKSIPIQYKNFFPQKVDGFPC